jgi:hypothetical protein
LIVFDSALASRPLDLRKDADRHRLERYQDNLRQVAALAQVPGMHSLFLSHHPVLGFAVEAQDGAAVHFGNPALLEAMRSLSGSRYFPPGIEASLHGHVHSFQAIDFSSGHPAALVAGHGGDNLDADLPDSGIAAAYASVPGVQIGSVAHASSFGYLLLERDDHGWIVRARRRDGSALALCALRQAHLACDSGAPVVHPAPAKNL